ncbi:phosphate ABC transporter permease subunit PstC [bacterium]|nr:phosphate ABC transporter permease subunit PstC [bacterium]
MNRLRTVRDTIASRGMALITVASGGVLFLIILGLFLKSRPILASGSFFGLMASSNWHPLKGEFGFLPFIAGTLWTTGTALIIAVPPCILTAIYLSEYASKRMRQAAAPFIDLLAGLPSVIYGIWGVLAVVPLIKNHIAPACGVSSSGYSILAGGIVLAIMIVPVIIHVIHEVLRTIPVELREASLALGASKWQTVRQVVLRKALPGVIAAVVLGLSRAFGETMAVLMVAGNVARVPGSIFDPAYPLPALIANNYGEMLSVPLYDSALMLASLVLLIIVVIFNIFSRLILKTVERRVC